MNVLIIMPDAHMHVLTIGPMVRSMRETPLTLAALAALVPSHMPVTCTLIDENIDSVPLDFPADLVGISVLTGTAYRAYTLADHFRRRGIAVVLGGAHVTLMPEEAKLHADAIVIGPADLSWPRLLDDFMKGQLNPVYQDPPSSGTFLSGLPSPRLDLMRRSGYMMPNTVMATRGCSHHCDFCSVPALSPTFQTRPINDVLRDIRALKGRIFAFNDVNLVDNRSYAMALFKALLPLKKKWGALATATIVNDPELVEMMAASGCIYLLIGFESIQAQALRTIRKGFNSLCDYGTLVELLHSYNISVQGCFVFGFDDDDTSVFDATVDRVQDLKIDIPRYSIYTPYPGTALFKRLVRENRIISFNWDDYDTMHVVFEPARMSVAELYRGFKNAYRQTFRLARILRRTASFDYRFPLNVLGNLTYKLFIHRLDHEPRFASAHHFSDSIYASQGSYVSTTREIPCRA